MAIERNKDERETHICMSGNSKKMQIFTTEYHIMRRLDKYVEESEAWKVIEVGKVNGKVVSKIYEAPRELLSMKKKKRAMTEEQRQKAAERLAAYRQRKTEGSATASEMEPDKEYEEEENFGLEPENDEEKDVDNASGIDENTGTENSSGQNGESPRLYPEKSKPKIVKVKSVIEEVDRGR